MDRASIRHAQDRFHARWLKQCEYNEPLFIRGVSYFIRGASRFGNASCQWCSALEMLWAKGPTYPSLGHRPRCSRVCQIGLKARAILWMARWNGPTALIPPFCQTWGAAPGWNKDGPLARSKLDAEHHWRPACATRNPQIRLTLISLLQDV